MNEYFVCYVFRDKPNAGFTNKEKAITYIRKSIEETKIEFGRDDTNLFRLYEVNSLGRIKELRWIEWQPKIETI